MNFCYRLSAVVGTEGPQKLLEGPAIQLGVCLCYRFLQWITPNHMQQSNRNHREYGIKEKEIKGGFPGSWDIFMEMFPRH